MFDASKIYAELPEAGRLNAEHRLIGIEKNPQAFALHQTVLKQELWQAEYRCNMAAWGQHVCDLPAPTDEERTELLKSRPAFLKDAIEAAICRHLLAQLDMLTSRERKKHEQEWDQANAAETEKNARDAFDQFEAAEREKRFQQWRKTSCSR